MGALALLPAAFLAFQLVRISQSGIQAAVLELQTKSAEKLAERAEAHFQAHPAQRALLLDAARRGAMGPEARRPLQVLAGRIAAERVGASGFAVLVAADGAPLLYPEARLSPEEARHVARWPITVQALRAHSVGALEFTDAGGTARVGAHAPVPSIRGALLILQPRSEAYLAAESMRRAVMLVLLFVAVIAVLGATFLARRLLSPVLALTLGAESVSRGDFLTRVDVDTGDELQDLAETFNKMTAQLRSYSVLQVDNLISAQRRTEAILFSINDGIVMLDKEGRIQLANRRAREILGVNPALVIDNRTLAEVMPPSRLREALLQSAASPRPDSFKEVEVAGGPSRFLRVTSVPVVTPGMGSALGVVLAVHDVTLEKDLDRMKEEFLQDITHDLRNPLGSAIGFLDILLTGTVGALSTEQSAVVSSIKRSTRRLMGMINNILDIAKMESGHLQVNLRTLSLAGSAAGSVNILESLARQKRIQIRLTADEEYSVEADADMIERVFTNLIGNAVKFTPMDGTITVSVEDKGPVFQVCVADTGEGIPAQYRERIFQKYEQVGGRRRGGTGLGLTIAKFFVEAHLGRIWVESELDKGSRFYFTVPKGLSLDPTGRVKLREGVA